MKRPTAISSMKSGRRMNIHLPLLKDGIAMKRPLRTPFFEIGVKNYIYGDDVLKMAMHADRCAENMMWTSS